MYSLTLLGAVSLHGPEGPMEGPAARPRSLALLALLAAAGSEGWSRTRLVGSLWPERDEERARHRLADTVYVLRRELGDEALRGSGDHLELDSERVRTDVAAFEGLLDEGDPEGAVEVYGGPFLEGFRLPGAPPEFEHWVDAERRRLADRYVRALERLAEDAEEAGEWQAAVERWKRLNEEDPYNSRYVLGLMEALAAVGDPGNALLVAEEHRRRMREELEARPTPAVTELVDRLRAAPASVGGADRAAEEGAPAESSEVETSGMAGDRYGSAAELSEAPRRIAAGSSRRGVERRLVTFGAVAAALLALAMAGVRWVGRSEAPGDAGAEGGPPRSVAVLPFSNLSPDPDNQYFSDGLAEEILNVLAKVNGLEVAARTSSFAYRDESKDVREIGNELGVGAVLEGSVRKEGDRVKVTAQLVQTSDGFHLWSEAYDRRLDDIFRIQEDIARQIVRAMRVELNVPLERAATRGRPTEDMEAYQLFLRARHLFNYRTEESMLRSVELYRRAIERDSTFAEAYGGLAVAYGTMGFYLTRDPGYDPRARARAVAERGLELDSTLAQGYWVRGANLFHYSNSVPDFPSGAAAFQRARELDPDDPTILLWTADLELAAGRFDAADTLLQRAMELNTASALVAARMARSADLQGEAERALDLFEESFDLGSEQGRFYLCQTAAINHRYEEVRPRWCDPASFDEDFLAQRHVRGLDSIMQGGPDVRRQHLEADPTDAVWLAPSLNLPRPFFSALETDPNFPKQFWAYVWHPAASAYRRDPRFVAWVRRMRLPEYWDATSWPDFCSRTQEGEIRCR